MDREHNFVTNKQFLLYVIVLIFLVGSAVYFLSPQLSLKTVDFYISNDCPDCSSDAVAVAAQIGRLDIVSLAVAFLGIGIGFFAIFSFFAIRQDAVDAAKVTAEEEIIEQFKQSLFKEELEKVVSAEVATQLKADRERTWTSYEDLPETTGAEEIGGEE